MILLFTLVGVYVLICCLFVVVWDWFVCCVVVCCFACWFGVFGLLLCWFVVDLFVMCFELCI